MQSAHPNLMRTFALLCLAALFACAAHADSLHCPAQLTSMEVNTGQYSPQPGAVFVLKNFSAKMRARGKSSPLCFNRTTEIEHGDVFVSGDSLSHLFSRKVQQSDSKMHDVKVEIKDGLAHITGKMKKLIDLNFDIAGPITTDGTNLILKAKQIHADGLPVKGLLGMLGKNLASMLNSESMNGVKAEGDTLIFVPESISHVRGRIAKLDLTNNGLNLDFEPKGDKKDEKKTAESKKPKTEASK